MSGKEGMKIEIKKEGGDEKSGRRHGGDKSSQTQRAQPTTPKFKADTEELHGHIYDVGVMNQSDLFTNTTKKLASYAGRTCCKPQDIRLAIKELEDASIDVPTRQTMSGVNSSVINMILSKDLDIYIKRESIYR